MDAVWAEIGAIGGMNGFQFILFGLDRGGVNGELNPALGVGGFDFGVDEFVECRLDVVGYSLAIDYALNSAPFFRKWLSCWRTASGLITVTPKLYRKEGGYWLFICWNMV